MRRRRPQPAIPGGYFVLYRMHPSERLRAWSHKATIDDATQSEANCCSLLHPYYSSIAAASSLTKDALTRYEEELAERVKT